MSLNLSKNYSINFSLPKRGIKSIKFIIIHYTGMRKESEAINKLRDHKSKVSCHYFIKNNGQILNLVPDLYEAWHAGVSEWKSYKSLNKNSIGIEINNPGHEYCYKNFSIKQITSIKNLLKYLKSKYKIKHQNILGHSDISPNRKKDPGEKFPWHLLAKKKLCHWHNLSDKKIRILRKNKITSKEEKLFFRNLKKIGYKKIISKIDKKPLIIAFQRKFRQSLINGKIDRECFLISKSLLKS